jgi:hypothetical protein
MEMKLMALPCVAVARFRSFCVLMIGMVAVHLGNQ